MRLPRRVLDAGAGLGEVRAVDQAAPPSRRAGWTFLGVLAATALSIVLAGLIRTQGAPDALRYLALLALFVAFVPFGRALRGLVVGPATTVVHERGVVVGDKRGALALPWREAGGLVRLRRSETLVGWAVESRNGRLHQVLLHGAPEQRATLATALEETAHRAGVRITEQG